MIRTNRRDFLRITSLGVGATLAAPSLNMAQQIADYDQYKVKRIPTYCDICFWKCAGWTYFNEKGEIWKLEGNENDPLSNGRFCPRGTAGLGMYRDPDRLKTPLIRTVKDGIQYYREATWPEALDFIAMKTKDIINESGAESLALFNHGTSGNHFSKIFNALGSGNITAPSYAQCKGPREEAFQVTFGKTLGSPEPLDIKNTKCLVLIGSHLGENMHNTQVQEMSELIDRKATIITVDPRLSTAAAHSTHWLPIKPATDIALMLAWMNVLITEGMYDKEYVSKYTFGIEDLEIHVADKTPEWAEKITRIPAEDIRKSAWAMAAAAPAVVIHPGRHVTWYGDDTQRLRCVAILTALLGSWGRKGGYFYPATAGIPSFPHPPYNKPKWTWKDVTLDRYPLAGHSVANALVDASHPDNTSDKQIKGWFVCGTNLIHTIPNQQRTLEALQNQELVVVVDTMPMEITGYADVVLPECTYLERYDDLRAAPYRNASIALRMPAAKPKYHSKPASWIAQKLGERLGLKDYFNYQDYDEVLDWQLVQIGSSLREMRKKGVIVMEREEKDMYMDESKNQKFNTPTGLIELYSYELEDEGFDPLPNYTAHPEPPEGYYRLNYGRAPMHTFAKTNNNPYLQNIMDENCIWMNPAIAKEWGLKNGQNLWLKNSHGKVSTYPGKVRITERMGPDSVYMVHGFGHSDERLSATYGKGISDSELITEASIDPIMGGTGMRGTFVTFLTQKPGKEVIS